MNEETTASEIMSGGRVTILGYIDDAIKAVQRRGLPLVKAIPLFGELLLQFRKLHLALLNLLSTI